MLRLQRAALVAVITCLCLALAAPAGAQSSRQKRDAARTRKAELARKLNAERATDAQLDAALKTLSGQLDAQAAKAAAARQAVGAASRKVAQAEAELKATEERMVSLRKAVVDRAVGAYIRPSSDAGMEGVANPSEAARRDALLAQVVARDQDLLDQLRAAKEDLAEQRAAADRAKAIAEGRKRAVDARLVELAKATAAKARLSDAVEARIRMLAAEADANDRSLAELTRIIESRDASRSSRGGYSGIKTDVGLIWPLRGRVTSEYGQRWGRLHAGIDIAAGTGTPIHAAKGGEVVFAGVMNGYGNCIVINHGGGLSTLYAHQSRLAARDGQDVDQGQVIGYVGSTGHSTGPHLHFETRVNGSPQNPRRYLP
jgi:murein DD-endopeptidase MepM/ murein hydrolase activator NlpD